MNNTVIHIGFPKTATSTIQTVMSNTPDINNIGKRFPFRKGNEYQTKWEKYFCQTIFNTKEIVYQDSDIKKVFEENIISKLDANKTTFISDEGFTMPTQGDNFLIAKRLKSFFPNAKILMVIRNQIEWIKSYYQMWPFDPFIVNNKNKYLTLDQWLERSFKFLNQSVLPEIRYNLLIEEYQKEFGKNNVTVLPYEVFKKDKKVLSETLAKLCKIDSKSLLNRLNSTSVNTGSSKSVHNLYIKYFGNSSINKLVPEKVKTLIYELINSYKSPPSISNENLNRLISYFEDSNKELNKKIDFELSKYNYSGL